MIKIKKLVKRYGSLVAVNEVDLSINAGEIFGFLGPNGAGKTTTMKMIAGLLQPTSGEIWVDDISLEKEPVEVKKIIGYIPDRPFIYEKLTAKEFLIFMAGLYDISPKEADSKGEELLTLFGLTHVKDELVENYSHGMKQRITMAAALIHEPKVIIVDEPMVGLDPSGSLLLRRTFRRLCEEKGVTIFLSTHTLSIAEEVCDRIGILNHGNLIAMGSLNELREKALAGNAGLEEVFLRLTGENSIPRAGQVE